MGCDIHFYVEKRHGGKWITCDAWLDDKDQPGTLYVPYEKSFYHDRNYDLFAILADVRNGRGFAGIKTGDGFIPVTEQRGTPNDCCPEYRQAVESYGEGHSHSWLTVAEIMAYDWTQVSSKTGIVEPTGWAQFKLTGEPKSWCGSVDGPGVMHVSPTDMERAAAEVTGCKLWDLFRDGNTFRGGPISKAIYRALGGTVEHGTTVTQISWDIPYWQVGSKFLGTTLPRLWRLGKPEDVRTTFFFDN